MHAECFGIIFGDIGVTIAGDVHDFIKMIGKAAVYDDFFEASTGRRNNKAIRSLRSKLSYRGRESLDYAPYHWN